MPRDVYEPPPPRVVSRRAFLRLGRGNDHDDETLRLRARPVSEEWLRALDPVERVLCEAAGERGLGLPLDAWRECDLQALPHPDDAFESVRSCFGAALAPRPKRMARELVRVVRPGGVVAITAWSPRSLPGRLGECDWGRHEVMTARLGPLLEGLELRTRSVQLHFADADALAAALGIAPQLRPHLDGLLASCNNAAGRVEVDARYLLAIGRRAV
jgi:SAM-dependent methyltransferase